MFVYNNFQHDTRVLKEAKCLTAAGYQVTVVALLDDDSKPYEENDGIRIIRVAKNPIHYRILRGVREFNPLAIVRGIWQGTKKAVEQSILTAFNAIRQKLTQLIEWLKPPRTDTSEKLGLLASVRQAFKQAWDTIRQRGTRTYLEDSWSKNPYFFLSVQGFFFLTYCVYVGIYKSFYWGVKRPFYWGVQRPAKIIWARYIKRGLYWGIQRPAKIIWARYIKRGLYWGIQRPTKIIWIRYIKRGLYWGIQRPTKIIWIRYIKRGFYFGIQRPAKIVWIRYFYRSLSKVLISFHRPLCFLDYHFRSLEVVKQERADIYHAHDLNVLAAAYQAARRHGAKLVYDSHEFYVERNRQPRRSRIGKLLVSRFERFLMRRSDAVITVSEAIAIELAQRYQVPVPTVILNVPMRTSKVSTNPEKSIRLALGISPDYHLLLYSGGITFNRGLEKVIESLVELTHCHLVFMGYGPEKYIEKLLALAVEFGVESRVSLFGPVPPEEVTTYAASADFGIAAIENVCLSYYYCAPNKLFEYVSAGLPVIASDFPEMKKIITHYEVGYTFDPSQPKDIARAAREILSDSERRRRMRENTFVVSEVYNWENESKKFLELYQTLS
ncbi:MAG TPA: hypothetical protein DCY91_02900 [Cyanobacteria bacterium UBA11370]|nr:hypothetical protein [Cyanobacteria bacterium UBA11370]HBY76426.1 hypothetical protein [Cyanobacteria bacterium UBA11148]